MLQTTKTQTQVEILGSKGQVIARLRVKQPAQYAVKAEAKTDWTPGAILVDRWGMEQTNIDFYCIVKRSGDFVTLLPMSSISKFKGSTQVSENLPGEVNYGAKTLRKKLKYQDGQPVGFSLRDYTGGGWVKLWDGKARLATHYA